MVEGLSSRDLPLSPSQSFPLALAPADRIGPGLAIGRLSLIQVITLTEVDSLELASCVCITVEAR
jgi:hypothetical protein